MSTYSDHDQRLLDQQSGTALDRQAKHRDPDGHILGVAIERNGLVFSMRKPARHHDVIRAMAATGVPTPIGPGAGFTQGFMTAFGFKDRALAARIINHEGLLTSEDLW